ncbi:hypothetical protein psyc5s11_20480 [Clostridium gelidum]|uniref:DUF3810 domain-containing protein n=1 Tax=Clostridium gelidum TaxID=704125 RepID=A0ABM7TAE5_9CLOT|nr:DUF3810 domain-containing protein [Clostridium gelidum]BCZ45981.1 hypothetical protein psyc5s11_20480 [Clostridium gelidum]
MSKLEKRKNKLSYKNKLEISGVLLGISALLFAMSLYIDGFANLYHKYIYNTLVNTVSRGVSLIPFSVYEIILYAFLIFIFIEIIIYIYLVLNKKISFKEIIIESTTNLLIYISIFIFLNMIGQSANCFKSDFITLTDLKIEDSSEEKLIVLCNDFKDKLNELDGNIKKDEDGFLKLDSEVKQEGRDNMKNLGKIYPCLQGFYPNPKPYISSELMSYQLLEGETTFTIEANYNNDMPKWNIPSTICHELSHIRGFNNENEANYISFLACINSKNYEYQYSGYLMAYSYCMNDLHKSNEEAFKKINNELSNNVKAELKNDALYWNKYRGGISKLYNKVYDVLLKVGGQEEGIKSYNGVVKLLISGYEVQFK